MKKLINDPADAVREGLEGTAVLFEHLTLLADWNVIVRNDLGTVDQRQVTILSGGGSGHEPAHAGYVGVGMLTAAVAGDVFTSPSTDSVLAGIRAVGGPAGVLLIIKNYTGDRLNFGLAAELARAEGIPVEIVIVADDVSLRGTVESSRRRGIAGTILVHKIAGAAAAAGLPLADVARLARAAAASVGSMGIALAGCTLPAVGKAGFVLADDEIEIGLGIHGEPGIRRTILRPIDEMVDLVVDSIVSDQDLREGDSVALLVNGLGATPPMELAIASRAAIRNLRRRGIDVLRGWTGTFLSALDMPGFSISLLRLDSERLALIDAPTNAPSWPSGGIINPRPVGEKIATAKDDVAPDHRSPNLTLRDAAYAAADALTTAEPILTDLDSKAGDGDLGASMQRGAAAVRALNADAWHSPSTALAAAGNALRRVIGGSSGPFFATALLRMSRSLADVDTPSPSEWATAFAAGVEAIAELGGAKPGDRTMLDTLYPAAHTLLRALTSGHHAGDAWQLALQEAEKGYEATRTMRPRLGRASYLGDRAIGIPDGGAAATLIVLQALTPVITGPGNREEGINA